MNNYHKTVVDHPDNHTQYEEPRVHKLLKGVILVISAIILSCGLNVNIFYVQIFDSGQYKNTK